MAFLQVTVLVPAVSSHLGASQFDKSDTLFDHPPGNEALMSVAFRLRKRFKNPILFKSKSDTLEIKLRNIAAAAI